MNWNKSAVLDLPLRLMVVFLVISMTAPLAFGVVEDQEENQACNAMNVCATAIINNVMATHYSGNGSYRNMEIKLPPDCSISIGGPADSVESFTIGYFYNDIPIGQMNMEGRAIPIVSTDSLILINGSVLELTSFQTTDCSIVMVNCI